MTHIRQRLEVGDLVHFHKEYHYPDIGTIVDIVDKHEITVTPEGYPDIRHRIDRGDIRQILRSGKEGKIRDAVNAPGPGETHDPENPSEACQPTRPPQPRRHPRPPPEAPLSPRGALRALPGRRAPLAGPLADDPMNDLPDPTRTATR